MNVSILLGLEILRNLSSSGVLVPGGFGSRGTEGKIKAAEWARKTSKPFLGIALFIDLFDCRMSIAHLK